MIGKFVESRVFVIGSGFSGLVAAATLAKEGCKVTILEKNDSIGGRARQFKEQGFTFDMGPSWYWMPDVFEDTFNYFGYKSSDFYELTRLDPSYTVFFEDSEFPIPADLSELKSAFEKIEKGSAEKLQRFLDEAAYKYKVGMEEFVWKPSHSVTEFADPRIVSSLFKLEMLKALSSVVHRNFKDQRLRQILEFPVLFLGATPWKIPALYSLMNHADLSLGTWYPKGGMYQVIRALEKINRDLGVEIRTGEEVRAVQMDGKRLAKIRTSKGEHQPDFVINSADYHHFEQNILPSSHRKYSPKYWEKRTMAPSSLLFYVGLDKKIPGIHHHSLFFDEDFKKHAVEIYEKPAWPKKPLFYMCAPSVTDSSVAPEGSENLFFLIPLAPGLKDDKEKHRRYFDIILERAEERTGFPIRKHIVYRRDFSISDFKRDYHAFKGNAYGLANTLTQTAFLKPKMRNSRVSNLLNCGQLTVPGPGVPPSLISGRLVGLETLKILKT